MCILAVNQNMITVPGFCSGYFLVESFLVGSYLSCNSSLNSFMKLSPRLPVDFDDAP